MTDEAVIRATYSDMRPVKSRQVLQIMFEVPIEQAEKVLQTLGFPRSDTDTWCAIARLVTPEPTAAPLPAAPKSEARSQRAKDDYALKPPAEQAVVRAARLCTEVRFQSWLEQHCAGRGITTTDQPSMETTAELLRRCIGVRSRGEIKDDPAAFKRWQTVETAYKQAFGLMAEERR